MTQRLKTQKREGNRVGILKVPKGGLSYTMLQPMTVFDTHTVFARNQAVRFPRITPLLQTIGNAIDFRFF